MFSLKLTNFAEVQAGHRRFLDSNSRLFRESLETAGQFAKQHVERYPEFRPRTGNLQKRTKTQVVRTSGGRLLRIDNTAKYADAIDTGARPHVIAAKNATHLRFYWAKHRRWVTTKKVNHPGNRPYKFMYRAWNAAGRVEAHELRDGMHAIARRF